MEKSFARPLASTSVFTVDALKDLISNASVILDGQVCSVAKLIEL